MNIKMHNINRHPSRYLFRFVFAVVIMGVTTLGQANAALSVVVAAGSGIPEMSQTEVRAIFLGKSKNFANGASASPAYQDEGSSKYAEFGDKVLRKSAAQLTQYWARLVFSGKGSPPRSAADDGAVKAFVTSTKGGIGYIDSASVDSSVKVVFKAD